MNSSEITNSSKPNKSNKIVFLDFDGVIVTARACIGIDAAMRNPDPVALGLVAKIATEGGAKIVISSSWRTSGYESICKHLTNWGFDLSLLHEDWTTKRLPNEIRGVEIKEWLDRHPEVTHYVILDDDSDMLASQYKNFVWTKSIEGLGLADYDKALVILGAKEVDKFNFKKILAFYEDITDATLEAPSDVHRYVMRFRQAAWELIEAYQQDPTGQKTLDCITMLHGRMRMLDEKLGNRPFE